MDFRHRFISQVSFSFKDESHFVYVDSSKDSEDTELGRLMRDFNQRDAKDMQASVLAERIRELKETEKGVEHMCEEMETIREEGIAEGQLEKARKTALNLAKLGLSVEEIASSVDENVQLVRGWISGIASSAK